MWGPRPEAWRMGHRGLGFQSAPLRAGSSDVHPDLRPTGLSLAHERVPTTPEPRTVRSVKPWVSPATCSLKASTILRREEQPAGREDRERMAAAGRGSWPVVQRKSQDLCCPEHKPVPRPRAGHEADLLQTAERQNGPVLAPPQRLSQGRAGSCPFSCRARAGVWSAGPTWNRQVSDLAFRTSSPGGVRRRRRGQRAGTGRTEDRRILGRLLSGCRQRRQMQALGLSGCQFSFNVINSSAWCD